MNEGLQGEPMTPAMVQHFDACLGCMACVTACPSGVQYDKLIEATRAQVERRFDRPAADRALRAAIFALFPYPRRLQADARAAAAVPGHRAVRGCCARAVSCSGSRRRIAAHGVARARRWSGPSRCRSAPPRPGRAAGTVGDAARLRAARVLPRRQRRHGPGALGRGLRRRRARRRRAAAAPCRRTTGGRTRRSASPGRSSTASSRDVVDFVVVNAAGCGSSMKEYADLLADDPDYAERARAFADKVRDVTELLAEVGPGGCRATRCPSPSPTTTPATSAMPRASAASPASCCAASRGWSCARSPSPTCAAAPRGSTTSSTPSPRASSGDRKAANVLRTGAQLLVTANPGCLMQVAASIERSGQPDGARPHRRGARRLDPRARRRPPGRRGPASDPPSPCSTTSTTR